MYAPFWPFAISKCSLLLMRNNRVVKAVFRQMRPQRPLPLRKPTPQRQNARRIRKFIDDAPTHTLGRFEKYNNGLFLHNEFEVLRFTMTVELSMMLLAASCLSRRVQSKSLGIKSFINFNMEREVGACFVCRFSELVISFFLLSDDNILQLCRQIPNKFFVSRLN